MVGVYDDGDDDDVFAMVDDFAFIFLCITFSAFIGDSVMRRFLFSFGGAVFACRRQVDVEGAFAMREEPL